MNFMIAPLSRGGVLACDVAGGCYQTCWSTHPSIPLKRGTAQARL